MARFTRSSFVDVLSELRRTAGEGVSETWVVLKTWPAQCNDPGRHHDGTAIWLLLGGSIVVESV